jgi:hypothetical protein
MVRRNLEQAFAPGFEVPEKFVDDVRAMTYPAYRDSARESEAYTDEKPLDQRLQEVGLPLLVVFGEQDQLYAARESLSAYAAIPGVETALIAEAGHSPNVETPEQTAAILGRFVNSLAPEPAPRPRPDPRPNQQPKQGAQAGGNRGAGQDANGQGGNAGGNRQGRGNAGGNNPQGRGNANQGTRPGTSQPGQGQGQQD